MNRSDCHSWFGSARSKRVTLGLGRGLLLGVAGAAMPSSRSTRRTVVAEVPMPRKRRSTSRTRRLPARGCAVFTATIAARFGSLRFARFASACPAPGASAAAPPSR